MQKHTIFEHLDISVLCRPNNSKQLSSSVSMVSDYKFDDQGSILGRGKGFIL
jgi:hypothetical protein